MAKYQLLFVHKRTAEFERVHLQTGKFWRSRAVLSWVSTGNPPGKNSHQWRPFIPEIMLYKLHRMSVLSQKHELNLLNKSISNPPVSTSWLAVTFRVTNVPRGWWISTHHLVFGEPPHTWGAKGSFPYKVTISYFSSFWLPEVCWCHLVVLIAKNSYKCRCLFGPLKLISISVNFEQKKQFTKKSLSSVEYVSTLMIRWIE